MELARSAPFHRFARIFDGIIMNEYPLGTNMDAKEYDRIGDLLTQIHRKVSNLTILKSANARHWHEAMLENLENALKANDLIAEYADKGWIE